MGAKAVFASQHPILWLTQSLAGATGLIVLRHSPKTNSTIKLLECMMFNGKTGTSNRADNIRIARSYNPKLKDDATRGMLIQRLETALGTA